MSFRGINTTVIQIRRQVFTEVARMAYANVKGEAANHLMRKIPYTIIPGEEGKFTLKIQQSAARTRSPSYAPRRTRTISPLLWPGAETTTGTYSRV